MKENLHPPSTSQETTPTTCSSCGDPDKATTEIATFLNLARDTSAMANTVRPQEK